MAAEIKKIDLTYSVAQMDLIILTVLDCPTNKKFITNVQKLYAAFSPDTYSTDHEKEYRVYLTKTLADTILSNNIVRREDIGVMLVLNGEFATESAALLDKMAKKETTQAERVHIDGMISRTLRYATVISLSKPMIDSLNDIKTNNYSSFDVAIKKVEDCAYQMDETFNQVRESIDDSGNSLMFNDTAAVMKNLDDVMNEEKNPAAKIKTGIQAFNLLLNGGFENGRCYCALGVAKGFKSGFLLNCAIWAKKYNNLKAKDPTKRPVVLYLTLENTLKETVKRLGIYAVGQKKPYSEMRNEDIDQALVANKIRNKDDDPVTAPALAIRYARSRSMTAADIDVVLDDMEKEGNECVFLIVDYMKRLNAVHHDKELRIELGNIADELTSIAKERDIPILTAMQLNRDAINFLNEAPENDFFKAIESSGKINTGNIGESIDIVQNVDCCFALSMLSDIKTNESGKVEHKDSYLMMKMLATRSGSGTDISTYYHRFMPFNPFHLEEDFNSPNMQSLTSLQIKGSNTNPYGNSRKGGFRG